jgi:hypothetical protein
MKLNTLTSSPTLPPPSLLHCGCQYLGLALHFPSGHLLCSMLSSSCHFLCSVPLPCMPWFPTYLALSRVVCKPGCPPPILPHQAPTVRGPLGPIGGHWRNPTNGQKFSIGGHWHRWCLSPTMPHPPRTMHHALI